MVVTVSGVYRSDSPEHTEQLLVPYTIEFEADPAKETPKTILERATIECRKHDPEFDSFKTHRIVWTKRRIDVLKPEPEIV